MLIRQMVETTKSKSLPGQCELYSVLHLAKDKEICVVFAQLNNLEASRPIITLPTQVGTGY